MIICIFLLSLITRGLDYILSNLNTWQSLNQIAIDSIIKVNRDIVMNMAFLI